MIVRVNARIALVLLLLVPIVAVLLPFMAGTASAAQLSGPPDADGNYAVCEVTLWSGPAAGRPYGWGFAAKCNYGLHPTGSHVTGVQVGWTWEKDGTATGTTVTYSVDSAQTANYNDDCTQIGSQDYWLRDQSTRRVAIDFCNNTTSTTGPWTSGIRTTVAPSCQVQYSNQGATYFPCRISSYAITTAGPTPAPSYYPVDYYPGGTPGGPPPLPRSGAVPAVECARAIRPDGAGGYLVDLYGTVPTGMVSGDTYEWSASWTATAYGAGAHPATPATVTLALPALSTMPPQGWSATFKLTRTYTGEAADTSLFDDVGGGDFAVPTDDKPSWMPQWFYDYAEDELTRGPDGLIWPASEAIGNWLNEQAGYWFQRSDGTYADSNADFSEPGGGEFTKVTARCFVLINPQAPATADRTTLEPPGAVPPPTADSAACDVLGGTSEWVSRIPLIGDALAGVVNLVAGLGCLLEYLFIPDDLPWSSLWDGFSTSFPFNVLGEGWGVVSMTTDAITTAQGGNLCGAIDLRDVPPPIPGRTGDDLSFLNLKLPTPSDSGCAKNGVSASSLAAENKVGDLFGWRTFFRTLMVIVLWLGVLYRVVRAFAPNGEKAEAVAP